MFKVPFDTISNLGFVIPVLNTLTLEWLLLDDSMIERSWPTKELSQYLSLWTIDKKGFLTVQQCSFKSAPEIGRTQTEYLMGQLLK